MRDAVGPRKAELTRAVLDWQMGKPSRLSRADSEEGKRVGRAGEADAAISQRY